jgi:uncharacterized protein YlzI (FlbEa/FlbD family)
MKLIKVTNENGDWIWINVYRITHIEPEPPAHGGGTHINLNGSGSIYTVLPMHEVIRLIDQE